ncbi:hypothetical protein BCR37DRAFT_392180 [Protomyces lactucae-debilis]|uniref:DUF336-domain-containing protein n=1 Tax=Protomyces lactucae-debilis TaxID=2754530 RepID=A0A1Y2FID8_PROLT|nr:uncharacterized protein BCR37DRAFT_392180 [Protomyces lactucae-debilis]ORY83711.1 hypothetical protein BCR37DRAFT_392180 [Protomyces lactucae-debilis]
MHITQSRASLTLEGARLATAAAEAHAKKIGVPMNIAIVDESTHLLSFSRMAGAKLTSISIALDKAFTAAGHRLATHQYKDAVWPGGVAFGINWSNAGRFQTIGGGIPFFGLDGQVIGAIGCSTGSPAQDQECAQAGVDAVHAYLRKDLPAKAKL